MPEDLFESEETSDRETIAAHLRTIADGLESRGTVTFQAGDESISLDLPERPTFEIEIERENGGGSLELELEWDEDGRIESDADAATEDTVEIVAEDEAPPGAESLGRFELYQDRGDEWRWRLVHRNGNIIATSGEGYTTRQNAEKGMHSVMKNAPGADVISDENE